MEFGLFQNRSGRRSLLLALFACGQQCFVVQFDENVLGCNAISSIDVDPQYNRHDS